MGTRTFTGFGICACGCDEPFSWTVEAQDATEAANLIHDERKLPGTVYAVVLGRHADVLPLKVVRTTEE